MDVKQVAAEIIATPAKVICIDTCAILDIARTERAMCKQIIEGAQFAQQLNGANPVEAYCVATELVREEFDRNVVCVRDTAISNISRTANEINRISRLASQLGTNPIQQLDKSLPDDLTDKAVERAEDMLHCCKLLSEDDESAKSAMARAVSAIKPGSKGRMSDCHIYEHFLTLSRELRNGGLTEPIFLVTSNTKDYFAPGDSHSPHPDIELELSDLGIVLLPHFASVHGIL